MIHLRIKEAPQPSVLLGDLKPGDRFRFESEEKAATLMLLLTRNNEDTRPYTYDGDSTILFAGVNCPVIPLDADGSEKRGGVRFGDIKNERHFRTGLGQVCVKGRWEEYNAAFLSDGWRSAFVKDEIVYPLPADLFLSDRDPDALEAEIAKLATEREDAGVERSEIVNALEMTCRSLGINTHYATGADLVSRMAGEIPKLKERLDTIYQLAYPLTPSGSEYHNDALRCVRFVCETMRSAQEDTVEMAKESNKLRDKLWQKCKEFSIPIGSTEECVESLFCEIEGLRKYREHMDEDAHHKEALVGMLDEKCQNQRSQLNGMNKTIREQAEVIASLKAQVTERNDAGCDAADALAELQEKWDGLPFEEVDPKDIGGRRFEGDQVFGVTTNGRVRHWMFTDKRWNVYFGDGRIVRAFRVKESAQ